MLFFFPRGVLDEILNLIESVSEGFSSYSSSVVNILQPLDSLKETPVFVDNVHF